MLEEESKPTILFVPNNNSMATILVEDGDMIGNVSWLSYQLILNHVVEGNFVTSDGLKIPTGTKDSNITLYLTAEA